MKLLILLLATSVTLAADFPTIPPVQGSFCTPHDSDFLEFRYKEKVPICKRNVSTWKKDEICERDGVEDHSRFTVDHILPLSIGGSNHDDNLWCQHKSLAVTDLEYEVYLELMDGDITHGEAVNTILDAKFHY